MPDTINIRKGLDLPISGTAELLLTDARSITTYAVKPTDFVCLTPRLVVDEGDTVNVGDAFLWTNATRTSFMTTLVEEHQKN